MTILRSFLLQSSIVVVAAIAGRAEASCPEILEFAQDGSIVEWEICHHDVQQNYGSQGRLRINVLVDSRPYAEELQWERAREQDGAVTFRAVDAARSLEIVRSYRWDSHASLVHTVAVRNSSPQSMSGVWLGIEPGGRLPSEHDPAHSLADYVYGFHREDVAVEDGQWQAASEGAETDKYAVTSRHRTLVIDGRQPFVVLADNEMPDSVTSDDAQAGWLLGFDLGRMDANETRILEQAISAFPSESITLGAAGYSGLMYSDLWRPLAIMSKWIEGIFVSLSAIAWGPGFAIILLAMAIRLVTLPVSLWSARRQQEFVLVSAKIKPEIANIRANYKGAEQSERILEIYRENQISPFSGLKGSLGLFVQIPFLLAVFNVTTVSSIFSGEGFLWIEDLSLPDAAAMLPISVSMLGNHLNALPILLGILNLHSSEASADRSGSSRAMSAIVTLLIVVVFYSFASALVLYWLTVNVIQAAERWLFGQTISRDVQLKRVAQ